MSVNICIRTEDSLPPAKKQEEVISRTIRARFTLEERNLILEYGICMDPVVEERIRKRKSNNGYVNIELNEEELEDLIGCVAAEANHTKKREVGAALNEICDQLESLED